MSANFEGFEDSYYFWKKTDHDDDAQTSKCKETGMDFSGWLYALL